jgi:hypothetical protein
MVRSTLLALFARRHERGEHHRDPDAPRRADAVYQAAQVIRGRIDAALAASRLDAPPERTGP